MEINLIAKGGTETRVLEYLQANASSALAEKINGGKKTLAGALKYAKEEAQKLPHEGGCVCVDDATVFGWIVHYFEEEHLTEKEKPAVQLPAGVAKVAKPVKAKVAKPLVASPATEEQKKAMIELLMGGSRA